MFRSSEVERLSDEELRTLVVAVPRVDEATGFTFSEGDGYRMVNFNFEVLTSSVAGE